MNYPKGVSETFDLGLLESHRKRWKTSPGLRLYYHNLWRQALRDEAPPILEIGSGLGCIKEMDSTITTSDLATNHAVDLSLNAYDVHTLNERYTTLIAVDVLHHLTHPLRFIKSCAGHLPEGGSLILVEPASTLLGKWFYQRFHHEPCQPLEVQPPYSFEEDEVGTFSNMGMAWALFQRDRVRTEEILQKEGLTLESVQYRDLFAYPATGGFSGPRILPTFAIQTLLYLEKWIPQLLLRKLGLRMIVKLRRTQP